jgi:hypothetical protein
MTDTTQRTPEHQAELDKQHSRETQILNMALNACHNMLQGRTPAVDEIKMIQARAFYFAENFQKEIETRWKNINQELDVKYAEKSKKDDATVPSLKPLKIVKKAESTKPKE